MTGFKYQKGSVWRKWDLHVHTKSEQNYTYSSDNAISQKEQNDDEYPNIFIHHIYSIDELGAIAITDHNKGDWLDRIIEANEEYVPENSREKITIFPGVEVESGEGMHLLVIFNPESQSDEVNRNYRKTTWKETIEHFMTEIVIAQGVNASNLTEQIMEKAKKWDAICIFAHVTSDKGFFRIASGSSKIRIYRHRLTQIFQKPYNGSLTVGQKNIVEGKDTQYCNDKGDPKSVCCITTSDAKKLLDIATNNCWIKADPTFEGLKQIIYELEERVYIGEEPPRKLDRSKIIKSFTVSDSSGWFVDDNPVLLNEGLISVIGGKGTGKTAVLDLIAYATKSYRIYKEGEKSFLKKAFKELAGTKIMVEWGDGIVDKEDVGDKLEMLQKDGKIRYIPQDFVDQLCSEIGKRELEEQIENVIFQKIPPENKADFTDFKSYKETQLKVMNDKKSRIAKQIEEINSKIYGYRKLINAKDSKNEETKKIEDAIKGFDQEMKKILDALEDFEDQKQILDELNSFTEQRSKLEKTISELKTKILKIEEMENEISVFLEDSKTFTDRLKIDLQTIGITEKDIEKIKVVLYPEDLRRILGSRKKEIGGEKGEGGEIEKQKVELAKLNKKIEELNSKIKLEKSKQNKINEINKSLSDLKKKKDSLNSNIKEIVEAEKELRNLLDDRVNLFINYFKSIFEEKEILKEIYSPLENILKESTEENEKLFDFAIQSNFDIETKAREGDKLIDHSNKGRFLRSEWRVLKVELEKLKFYLNLENKHLSLNDETLITDFLENVKNLFLQDDKREQYTIISQLRKEYTEQDFDNWQYSTRYYNISYSLEFNGIELDNLSPGLKGVALLILFLKLDEEDRRPILIDQPEENLDNRSVYRTLMKYFRDAKKRRQVIIVTHNPNLVVNTDSEQIIVADFDRGLKKQNSRICYVSGALENTFKNDSASIILEEQGIREHVCEILEGGKEAFEKRERKYGFKS